MPVECFDPSQELLVVAKRDEHLALIPDGLLQDRQWALRDFVFFQLSNLCLVQLRLRYVLVLTGTERMMSKIVEPKSKENIVSMPQDAPS